MTDREFVNECIRGLVNAFLSEGLDTDQRINVAVRDTLRQFRQYTDALLEQRHRADTSLIGPVVEDWWCHQPEGVRDAWERDQFAPSLTSLVNAIARVTSSRERHQRQDAWVTRKDERARCVAEIRRLADAADGDMDHDASHWYRATAKHLEKA